MDRLTYNQLREVLVSRPRRIVSYKGRTARTLADLDFIARVNGFDPLDDAWVDAEPLTQGPDATVSQVNPETMAQEPEGAVHNIEAEVSQVMAMSHKQLGDALRAAKAHPIPGTTAERRTALMIALGLAEAA